MERFIHALSMSLPSRICSGGVTLNDTAEWKDMASLLNQRLG